MRKIDNLKTCKERQKVSILVSVIINQSNMAAAIHVKLCSSKVKSEVLLNLDIAMKKKFKRNKLT